MPTLRETFYPDCLGYLDLRAIKNKRVKQAFFMLDDDQGIKAFIKENIKDHDLYFGVATRDAAGGKKENIVEIPGVWVDIDFKDIDPKEAERRLAEFSIKPTVIVESGGGLHVYWVFREHAGKDDIDQCESIMRGLAMRLGGDLNSTDASRILRIPATRNQKYKPARQVVLRYHNGARYNLSDFEDFAAAPREANSPKANPSANLDAIMACKFMQHCRDDASTLKEPEWYAMVTVLAREPGGPALIHELSKPHKGYKRGNTDSKIIHAINDTGPMTCEAIKAKCGFDCGQDCHVKSPVALKFSKAVSDATRVTNVTDVTGVTNETIVTSCNQDETKKAKSCNQDVTRNLNQELLDWLQTCDGEFSLKDVAGDFSAKVGSHLYNNIKLILFRFNNKNIIERVGRIRGVYRKVQSELELMNWWDCNNEECPLKLPLSLGSLCKIMPRSIIVVAGEQNSSKSAIALNIAKDNCETFQTHYFNSEMSSEELRERIMRFQDVDLEHFRRVNFYSRSDNFHDVIQPDGLNIIDFMEIHDDFWRVGGMLRDIYDKLNQGIAVVNLQKAPGKDWGRGGTMSIEKARLYLAVSTLFDGKGKPFNRVKVVKAKLYRDLQRNPNGMVRDFRVYGGAALLPLSDWEHPKK